MHSLTEPHDPSLTILLKIKAAWLRRGLGESNAMKHLDGTIDEARKRIDNHVVPDLLPRVTDGMPWPK